MDILHLPIMFLVIVVIIRLKEPLFMAMIGGIAATIILFRVDLKDATIVLGRQTVAWDTIDVLPGFYLIILLRLMLEKKGRLTNVKDSFNRLLKNHRMNTIVSPTIMGLLPSTAVMTIYADMVDRTCGEYMDDKNKTFVSCYYRRIPEMFLPASPVVLLGFTLSGRSVGVFVLAMIPMVVATCLVVYITHSKGAPREMPLLKETINKKAEVINLVGDLWALVAVLLIVIIFNLSARIAAPLIIASDYIFDHFSSKDLPDLMVRSAEPILLGNMYLIILFKDILSYTDVMGLLPDFVGQFSISTIMPFGLLFFADATISGSQTIIALCTPIAFLAFPQGGISLLVMLMGVAWATMQISPTHVRSFVAADFYHTTLGDIVVRTLGPAIIFSIIAYGYGLLLGQIFYQRIYKQELIIQGGKI